ncbi:hypothetical protein ABT261_38915, partial [Amycolatopsis sp. NPDC000740]
SRRTRRRSGCTKRRCPARAVRWGGHAIDVGGAAAALAHLESAVEAGHGEDDMAAVYEGIVKKGH